MLLQTLKSRSRTEPRLGTGSRDRLSALLWRRFDLPTCLLLGLVTGGYLYGTAPCLYHGGDLVPCLSRGRDGIVVAVDGLFEWTTLPDLLMVYLVAGSSIASYFALVASRCIQTAYRKLGSSPRRMRKLILRWFDVPACIIMGPVSHGYIYVSVSCLSASGGVALCAVWGIAGVAGAFTILVERSAVPDLPMVDLVLGISVVMSYLAVVLLRCVRVALREDMASTGASQ